MQASVYPSILSFYKKAFVLLLLCGVWTGCGNAQSTVSDEAGTYLEEVFRLLETRSVRRNSIDWPAFREKVLFHARNAKTVEDTYPSVGYAIQELGDRHSYFVSAVPQAEYQQEEDEAPPLLPDEKVPENIGYVRVRFCMGDSEAIHQYRDDLSEKIREQDKPGSIGWIIDLRGNFGGNMWPMLSGLSPFFGDLTVGYFMGPDRQAEPWRFENGTICSGTVPRDDLPRSYKLRKTGPYIAVLTDSSTASSGEAITVAFKGHTNTKSFGQATYGVSTGNRSHSLSDGSRINLSETVFADRHKTLYGKSIVPDVVCDDALHEAIRWLNETAALTKKH